MPFSDTIEWTKREELCERLGHFVRTTSPEEPLYSRRGNDMRFRLPSEREQAIRLLCLMARPDDLDVLEAVARNPEEAFVVREQVFPHLLRLGGELPADRLDVESDDGFFHVHEGGRPAAQYLLLFRHSVPLERMSEVFDALSSGGRLELLDHLADEPLTPRAWIDWLYDRWLNEDRFECVEQMAWTDSGHVAVNVKLAARFRGRPECEQLIAEYRTRPLEKVFSPAYEFRLADVWKADWLALGSGLWQDELELAEAVQQAPDDFRGSAEALKLPLSSLLTYWSQSEVVERLERELRSIQGDDSGGFPPDRGHLLQLAQRCPGAEVDDWLSNLYLCPDMPSSVRTRLYDVLWERGWRLNPKETRIAVRQWAGSECSLRSKGEVLLQLSEAPEPEDREYFVWAAGVEEKPEFRYLAIRAMSRLRESSVEWQAKLRTLRDDPDPDVGVAAAGTLLRLGAEEQRTFLVDTALNAEDPLTQREAIEALGECEGERHLAVFGEVLRTPVRLEWGHIRKSLYSNPTLEAARQLARLGTQEALTKLLRGCLRGGETVPYGDRCELFLLAVRRAEGEEVELLERSYWRWERPWEWRCA